MPSKDQALKDFAKLLAGADEKERQALHKRATLIAMNEADPEVFEPPIATLEEYLATPIEVPPSLVSPEGLLVRGGLVAVIGRAGKGKTVLNLNRFLRWAAGKPLFAGLTDPEGNVLLKPERPLKILVIENEGAAGMFHKQIGLMLNSKKYMNAEEKELAQQNVHIWGEGGWSGLKIDRDHDLNNVKAGVEQLNPDIVFLEPFRGLWQGDENNSTEMANAADRLQGIATEYNCAVIISHHERKSGAGEDGEKMSAGRGSTVLEGIAQAMENFEAVKGGEYRELSWSKSRHVVPPLPIRMEWDPEEWWYKHVPLNNLEQSMLALLRQTDGQPLTIGEFAEQLEETEPACRKIANRLEAEGRIKITKDPQGFKYRLATETGSNDQSGGLTL